MLVYIHAKFNYTNRFLYFDDIWCIIPVWKERFESHWFHASINHIDAMRYPLPSLWEIRKKKKNQSWILNEDITTDAIFTDEFAWMSLICSYIVETSSDLPRQSSAIFGNVRKMFRNICKALDKSSGKLREWVGNLPNIVKKFLIAYCLELSSWSTWCWVNPFTPRIKP